MENDWKAVLATNVVTAGVAEKRKNRIDKLLQAMAFFIILIAGLGEDKIVNAQLGGLPKALTFLFVGLAFLRLLVEADFVRTKNLASPFFQYCLYVLGLTFWSLFIWYANNTDASSIKRGASKILYQSIALMVAVCLVYLFGRLAIDIFAAGICAANFGIMLIEMPAYGVGPSIQSLVTSIITIGETTEGYAEQLEIHEVTFLYALFILYYMLFAPKDTRQDKIRNIVLTVFSIFFFLTGMKRILIPAVILGFMYVIAVGKLKKYGNLIIGTGIFICAFCWFYLYFVSTGDAATVMDKLGINSMGRSYIWALVRKYYEFTPAYIGRGFEAVDAIVTYFYKAGLIDVAYPLHNDVLKVYVELGFVGMTFWSVFLYVWLPIYWVKKYGQKMGLVYMAMMIPMTITYLTDNTAFYFWVTLCLRLIPMGMIADDGKENAEDTRVSAHMDTAEEIQAMIREEIAKDSGMQKRAEKRVSYTKK